MTYAVKEIFYTVQGEGVHAGTAALFIRFAGCNLWSGRDEHRERDAVRNGAECPRWCDTDFVDGTPRTLEAIVDLACAAVGDDHPTTPLVVMTGGEPLLQVDVRLLKTLSHVFPTALLAVETNGTIEPSPEVREWLSWICCSPKLPAKELTLEHGDELKVVVPAYDPCAYDDYADNFDHQFVSAEASTTSVGQSLIVKNNLQLAAAFAMRNPQWKLTLQAHKIIGVP